MKLPNGYGSITKLSGNRRKPYMVRVWNGTVFDSKTGGYKEDRPVLGYYATKKEALKALSEYNDNPFNIKDRNITFGKIYEDWEKKNLDKMSKSSQESKKAAYKYCEPIKNMKIRDIKADALQEVIDRCPYGTSTKKNIKTLMKTVFECAMKNDYVTKDYSSFVTIEISEPVIDRVPFTDAEIQKLWSMSDQWDIQVILILLYSGMRVNELLKNSKENIDLEQKSIYVPKELAKNKSSIRYVPIHDKIYPFILEFYSRATDNIITNPKGFNVPYNNFVARNLKRINNELGSVHRFHDTRHTFITKAHRTGMDPLTLKKIVGHMPDDITQKVYTHITIEDMHRELKKID